MNIHSLSRWFLNLIKNNLWVIIISLIMWILSSANGLRLSEISVQNAQENLKITLGSYTFLSGQLESISTLKRAKPEQDFMKESLILMRKSNWSFQDIESYISTLSEADIYFSSSVAPTKNIDSVIKRVLFVQKHTDLIVSIYTYNDSATLYNQLLTHFPERFFIKKMDLKPYPLVSVPSCIKTLPVMRIGPSR